MLLGFVHRMCYLSGFYGKQQVCMVAHRMEDPSTNPTLWTVRFEMWHPNLPIVRMVKPPVVGQFPSNLVCSYPNTDCEVKLILWTLTMKSRWFEGFKAIMSKKNLEMSRGCWSWMSWNRWVCACLCQYTPWKPPQAPEKRCHPKEIAKSPTSGILW